ncbi:MAG: hypothetical protein HOC23_09980 [Halieaceae bacterium]|nr:hypothetical protein [Halieaceae bacterium]
MTAITKTLSVLVGLVGLVLIGGYGLMSYTGISISKTASSPGSFSAPPSSRASSARTSNPEAQYSGLSLESQGSSSGQVNNYPLQPSGDFTAEAIQAVFDDIQRRALEKDAEGIFNYFTSETQIEASLPSNFSTNSKQPFLVEHLLDAIKGSTLSIKLSTIKPLIRVYSRPYPKYRYEIKAEDILIARNRQSARINNVRFATIAPGKGWRTHEVYASFSLQNINGKPFIDQVWVWDEGV